MASECPAGPSDLCNEALRIHLGFSPIAAGVQPPGSLAARTDPARRQPTAGNDVHTHRHPVTVPPTFWPSERLARRSCARAAEHAGGVRPKMSISIGAPPFSGGILRSGHSRVRAPIPATSRLIVREPCERNERSGWTGRLALSVGSARGRGWLRRVAPQPASTHSPTSRTYLNGSRLTLCTAVATRLLVVTVHLCTRANARCQCYERDAETGEAERFLTPGRQRGCNPPAHVRARHRAEHQDDREQSRPCRRSVLQQLEPDIVG
jgi:hypothetical protein